MCMFERDAVAPPHRCVMIQPSSRHAPSPTRSPGAPGPRHTRTPADRARHSGEKRSMVPERSGVPGDETAAPALKTPVVGGFGVGRTPCGRGGPRGHPVPRGTASPPWTASGTGGSRSSSRSTASRGPGATTRGGVHRALDPDGGTPVVPCDAHERDSGTEVPARLVEYAGRGTPSGCSTRWDDRGIRARATVPRSSSAPCPRPSCPAPGRGEGWREGPPARRERHTGRTRGRHTTWRRTRDSAGCWTT